MAVKLHKYRLIQRVGDLQLMMNDETGKFNLMTALDSFADGVAEMQAKQAEANEAEAQAAREAMAKQASVEAEERRSEFTGADEAMAAYLTGDDNTED